MRKIIIVILGLCLVVLAGLVFLYDASLSERPHLSSTLCAALPVLISLILFLVAAWPNRRGAPRAFAFAVACLAWSILQIPVWLLVSGVFPPTDLSLPLAILFTVGAILGFLGPVAPGVIALFSMIRSVKYQ